MKKLLSLVLISILCSSVFAGNTITKTTHSKNGSMVLASLGCKGCKHN